MSSEIDVLEGDPEQPWNDNVQERPQTRPMPRLPEWVADVMAGMRLRQSRSSDEPSDGFRYWVPKPSLRSFRAAGLLFVNLATAIGLTCFAMLGFLFVQLDRVHVNVQWTLTLVGSVSIAIGSEVGTLVTVVEIFRKIRMTKRRPVIARVLISVLTVVRATRVAVDALISVYKDPVEKSFSQAIRMIDKTLEAQEIGPTLWDWAGLVISACTSLSGVALGQVSVMRLAGLDISYPWFAVVQQWSPVALALFGVLDGYVNHAEYGMFLAYIGEAVKGWFKEREEAKREIEKRYLS